ncbi:hypothetical protein [Kribbella italica]|uniref:PH domain-containing protein n=1 Tax=Kribbella italica TaxID=1540520 RepID=A0A7W9J7P5_9ACTN|nr:hypothetical protein [Kribbella italica]MBB5837169.1 hypothetical protein [Kribbella italica]
MRDAAQPETWTAEIDLGSGVDVPARRGRAVFWLVGLILVVLWCIYLIIDNNTSSEPRSRVLVWVGIVGLALLVPRGLWLVWRLVKPSVLTFDLEGVQLGPRKLKWTQIRDVTLRPKSPVFRYLAIGKASVRIRDIHGTAINVTHEHVDDLDPLAEWLRRMHDVRTSEVE